MNRTAISRSKVWRLASWPLLTPAMKSLLPLALLAVAGCAHHHRPASELQPQADAPLVYEPDIVRAPRAAPLARIPITPVPPGGVSADDLEYVATHRPILSEIGLATWYTASYQGRKAANGQIFDNHALTAAHRTLPMGSLIVVTNLKTGQSSAMRVSDRGPFVEGRTVDLTIASARATGVYPNGLVRVRIDVYRTPKSIWTGGRWCVQIGGFKDEQSALKLKAQLQRNYPDSKVIEFPGENRYWVRIRPLGDDREEAEMIASRLQPAEGEAFLTRLD